MIFKRTAYILFTLFLSGNLFAQEKVYYLNLKADLPIIAAGCGLTAFGFIQLSNKMPLDRSLVMDLGPEDVNRFDRSAVGNTATKAVRILGDVFMFAPVALTFIHLAGKRQRKEFLTISALYLEAFALTGTVYGMTAAFVDRKRPYVFDKNQDIGRRTSKNARNSFIGGHIAVTATATFFAAKVFHDFYPDSKWRYPVWILAALMPVVTGYARYADGQHFLSDLITGYLTGAGSSLLVLQLHKKNRKRIQNLSFSPWFFQDEKGVLLSFSF